MASLMVALKGSKGDGFSARKVIPLDVRVNYARLYGVTWEEKLRIPPGTAVHEAKARCGEWLAEIETRIGSLRAVANGEGQPLTRQNAHALAGRWYSWFLGQHETDIRTPMHWQAMGCHLVWEVIRPLAPEEYEEDSAADPEWEWKAAPEVRAKVRPVVAELARTSSFLIKEGRTLTLDATHLFLDAVEDNLLAAYSRLEQLSRGDYTPDVIPQQFPEYLETHKKTQGGLSCWALFQAWVSAVPRRSSTIARWNVVFKSVQERFSDATDISYSEAKTWMNGLANDKRSLHTIATVWRTALKTVFTWGVNEKRIRSNPFKEIKIAVPRKIKERETKAFTTQEAQVILSATLVYAKPETTDERARRWVPWICAYTGARAGEITQLRGSDIELRGNDYFAKLSPSAGPIKTGQARTVPLHEHLIAQGFAAFVEAVGPGPLFYTPVERAETKPTPVQGPAERTRGRLGQWVRSLGITDPEVSPNHAWRHTFKAMALRSNIDERHSDAITGHAPPTAGRAYTKPTPEDLAEAMRRFPRYRL